MKSGVASVSSKTPDSSVSLGARFLATLLRLSHGDDRGFLNDLASHNTKPVPNVLVALSGGMDSVVLLSLASALQTQNKISVRAVYIDHGLQSQSTEWAVLCADLCGSLNIDFECVAVDVDLQSGLSPEAAARDARYGAFKQILNPGEYLCTAHHADDQAETLLLQLFRGAGVNGLASMPEVREFGSGFLVRPLLQVSRAEIADYAKHHRLSWCEDPSNKDLRYDRNYLRHELLPAIEARWPGAVPGMSRSALHCGEALVLNRELALQDLPAESQQLSVQHLASLEIARRKNLLRYWITSRGFKAPSAVQLHQILKDLVSVKDQADEGRAKESGQGRVSFDNACVARYQDDLYLAPRGSFDPLPDFEYQWPNSVTPLHIKELDWHLDATAHDNLRPYIGKPLFVRNRRGGERFRPDPNGQSTSVKSLLQQRRTPPWLRSRLVFVFHQDQLIHLCAPGFVF